MPIYTIATVQTVGGPCYRVLIDGMPSGNGGYSSKESAERYIRDRLRGAAQGGTER